MSISVCSDPLLYLNTYLNIISYNILLNLLQNNSHNLFYLQGRELQLSNISREGRGVYRCIADNNVIPTASQDITLYINFKPFAKAVQTTYGQAQNMLYDVTIECRVSGKKSRVKMRELLKEYLNFMKYVFKAMNLKHLLQIIIIIFYFSQNSEV